MSVTIYHNPGCGTPRNTLAMIRQSGIEPTIIEYLKTLPSREKARRAHHVGARAFKFGEKTGTSHVVYSNDLNVRCFAPSGVSASFRMLAHVCL
jgi:hypothetical protein